MKPLAQINVIPFIDVMLVLLAIVLTTATFVAQGRIPVDMPSAGSAVPLSTRPALEITLDAAGRLFVDGEASTLDALAATCRDLDAAAPVVLRVDRRSAFEHFVGVVDVLKAATLNNLSILTLRDQG